MTRRKVAHIIRAESIFVIISVELFLNFTVNFTSRYFRPTFTGGSRPIIDSTSSIHPIIRFFRYLPILGRSNGKYVFLHTFFVLYLEAFFFLVMITFCDIRIFFTRGSCKHPPTTIADRILLLLLLFCGR